MKVIRWDEKQPRLTILTAGSTLYFWTPLGSRFFMTPYIFLEKQFEFEFRSNLYHQPLSSLVPSNAGQSVLFFITVTLSATLYGISMLLEV